MRTSREVQGRPATTVAALVVAMAVVGCAQRSDEPDLDLWRAQNALAAERYDWARVYLQADLEENPTRQESLKALGVAWLSDRQGSLSKGIEAFERYHQQFPEDAEAGFRLVDALLRFGETERALRMLASLPSSADTSFLRARTLFELDAPEAAEALEELLALDASSARVQELAGRIRLSLGDLDGARAHFERAVEADPLDPAARFGLGTVLGRVAEAEAAEAELATFELLRSLAESEPSTCSPETLEELDRRIQPRPTRLLERSVLCALQRGQDLSSDLEELRTREDAAPAVLLAVAGAAHREAQTAMAQSLYDDVLERAPHHLGALYARTHLAYETQRYGEAKALLERALGHSPHHAPFHYLRGLLTLQSGDEAEAEAALRRTVELAPWVAHHRITLVELLLAQGRRDEALAILDGAPDDPQIEAYRKRRAG